jgi:hypothetical protein
MNTYFCLFRSVRTNVLPIPSLSVVVAMEVAMAAVEEVCCRLFKAGKWHCVNDASLTVYWQWRVLLSRLAFLSCPCCERLL